MQSKAHAEPPPAPYCARCGTAMPGGRYTELVSGEQLCKACFERHCRERGADPAEVTAALERVSRVVWRAFLRIEGHDPDRQRTR
ncbi:MAG TPA: hypothetical protein VKF37_09290 [Chloroflexota bacterium]|nr:hypothetical protein [Chloroflexota bacterium]